MQYPIIDLITDAYINNGWTGLDIPQTITYEPIQLGSGDPSPTNVRPILPATILNIGGNDVPVYGGTLDVTSGVLTVDRAKTVYDGTGNAWRKETTYNYFSTRNQISDAIDANSSINNFKSNLFPFGTIANINTDTGACLIWGYVRVRLSDMTKTIDEFNAMLSETPLEVVYRLAEPVTYQLTQTELENAIGIKDDIAYRLKLPLPHYFPHPVIDALQRAAAGTHTADDTEILQHYLTPLGIGGI